MYYAQHSPGMGSPAGQLITQHWQQQLFKCETVRSSRSPHFRARANALASRTVAKSAIPITNPNKPEEPVDDENHPSSTVAPIAEAPRPTAVAPPQNNWGSLDMGGVGLKNLPPSSGLFSFTFLLNLYLNHNALEVIPPQISALRHLELLDISGNNLQHLPPELGMLTQLKELYFFDNQVTTIPHELGTLHQLQTLGIEGNPMEPSLKAMVQKDGTPGTHFLSARLMPRLSRLLRNGSGSTLIPRQAAGASGETFSVLCYNILCEKYATERLYGYTPKEIILSEVVSHSADFLCLQEVDIAQYEDYFVKNLQTRDYEGVFWPKSPDRRMVDGCATFYNAARFKLVEKVLIEFSAVAMQRQDFKKTDDMFNRVLGKDHIAVVCLLEDKQTGTRYVIANAHIHWDPAYRDVKLVQVALLVEEIEKVASAFARYPPPAGMATKYTDGSKIPVIICGDFNSVPESGVYEFLQNGVLSADHQDFMKHVYGRYTEEGLRHRLGLKSAYSTGQGEEILPMTNYTPSFRGVIDYVWYSTATLAVNAVLGEVDREYLDKVVGFPNAHFPSE
ncbi:Endonuclease/exonuclease/phosphatase [Desarmillaria tabescens]|uniref:CCR4-Not complex 3'-5'-exoribonuclease subunit Ccr4 n=1 Tax=Armillaria tabescens TaxID=1929756 RepID=A0AA39NBK8_ARMTA|nr:Endonuclease/exonuclease/phosphatase [Desarmillaria tabescens]KAK0462617.1 Endonuclease/exonuclease/phosphatase [Desarmillaria tabescens]